MKTLRSCLVVLLIGSLTTQSAWACLWDYDTLQMERQRFPDVLELATGKFLRHSKQYYQWRVEDRLARIETSPDDLALYDDLAVAYDKLGLHDKAIETMLKKEDKQPGLYETYANLGTFYIHSGKLEEGLAFIEKAIEINPNAHFGREVYQKRLVEYVLSKQGEDELSFPLSADERGIGRHGGFAAFLIEKSQVSKDEKNEEIRRALKGVLGMMRFGHYDSPVLLEAVGDLLLANWNEDGKRLAARAYLKASYEVKDRSAREAYRKLAENALNMQTVRRNSTTEISLSTVEATFQSELKEASAWYSKVQADEIAWINAGADVDAEFTKKYYEAAAAEDSGSSEAAATAANLSYRLSLWAMIVAIAGLTFLLALVAVVVFVLSRLTPKKGQLAK